MVSLEWTCLSNSLWSTTVWNLITFVVYVDDLLNDLRISGYGVYTVSTKSEPIFLL